MPPHHWKILTAATALAWAGAVHAEDSKACFSEFTNFNVCDYARQIQAYAAPAMPIKMNANVTLLAIMAVERRLIIQGIWDVEKPDLDATLKIQGMSLSDMSAKIDRLTQNTVCSDKAMSAFVGLHGEIQYVYKSRDGFMLFSPLVTTC